MRSVSLSRLGDTPRILLTRTDALGDLILCTPTFRALRETYPNAHIAVLCRSYAAPALQGNPAVDSVIQIELESSVNRSELALRLQAEKYDLSVALYPSSFAADVLRRARIPIRIGSARRFHSWKFTHRISQSRKSNTQNEAACNLALLAPLGIEYDNLTTEVLVSPAEVEAMQKRLRDSGIDSPFVALHPGSGGSALDWPLEKFSALANRLVRQGILPIYTGSVAEAALIAERGQNQDLKIVSLAGKTDLRELAALLSLAEIVIANSTGPLHLAAAVGTDTIGLFPPARSMSPVRWAPPVANATVIAPAASVCRCRNGRCRRRGASCMDSISVETVFAKIEERLDILQAR